MLKFAGIAVATILATGIAADVDTSQARSPTGCVHRLAIGHVPGRLDTVWVLRCIPTRTPIHRF